MNSQVILLSSSSSSNSNSVSSEVSVVGSAHVLQASLYMYIPTRRTLINYVFILQIIDLYPLHTKVFRNLYSRNTCLLRYYGNPLNVPLILPGHVASTCPPSTPSSPPPPATCPVFRHQSIVDTISDTCETLSHKKTGTHRHI